MVILFDRLVDFAALILKSNCSADQVATLAHRHLFAETEQDTAVFVYGQYDVLTEQHSESALVVSFIEDGVCLAWQDAKIKLCANLPNMGWDDERGRFGLGGDWWKPAE